MKHLFNLGLFVFLFLIYSNSQAQQSTKVKRTGTTKNKTASKETLSMQGAYSMLKQTVNDGSGDSSLKTAQLKIFTGRYMMYASPHIEDSLADYGVGTYKIQDGKIMEYIFYTASGGAHKDTFELDIRKTGDGYSQVIIFPEEEGRRFVLTEDYKNVSRNLSSPLDGAWKQTKRMYITEDGKTVAEPPITQYKVFQSGHFIWANTFQDSATQKPVSTFGYGSFEMNGNNQATEVNANSTYLTYIVGKPFVLQLKFMGKDAYQQTIMQPNGSQAIEIYERLR